MSLEKNSAIAASVISVLLVIAGGGYSYGVFNNKIDAINIKISEIDQSIIENRKSSEELRFKLLNYNHKSDKALKLNTNIVNGELCTKRSCELISIAMKSNSKSIIQNEDNLASIDKQISEMNISVADKMNTTNRDYNERLDKIYHKVLDIHDYINKQSARLEGKIDAIQQQGWQ